MQKRQFHCLFAHFYRRVGTFAASMARPGILSSFRVLCESFTSPLRVLFEPDYNGEKGFYIPCVKRKYVPITGDGNKTPPIITPPICKRDFSGASKMSKSDKITKIAKKHYHSRQIALVELLIPKPYKTCRLRRLLEPFVNFRPEKYQKCIRFPTQNAMRFLHFRNMEKPLVKQRFGASKKVHQNTL